jgi:hypothetical protein
VEVWGGHREGKGLSHLAGIGSFSHGRAAQTPGAQDFIAYCLPVRQQAREVRYVVIFNKHGSTTRPNGVSELSS